MHHELHHCGRPVKIPEYQKPKRSQVVVIDAGQGVHVCCIAGRGSDYCIIVLYVFPFLPALTCVCVLNPIACMFFAYFLCDLSLSLDYFRPVTNPDISLSSPDIGLSRNYSLAAISPDLTLFLN